MKARKLISCLLAASFIVTSVSACAKKEETTNNEVTKAPVTQEAKNPNNDAQNTGAHGIYTAPGEFPIVTEPVTITVLAAQDGEFSRFDNLQTKELEEKTGIHIEWLTASSDNIKDKMNLAFSSGEMPDVIMLGATSNRLDKATEASLGAQGLLLPLNDLLDTVSVGYKEAFERLDGLKDYITTPDGYIYNLPSVDGSLHVQYQCKLWLNTVWLDNLGLKMPTTTDEFYEVLKAFKEQDANGNGDPNDEIPLSTVKSGGGTQIDTFLMNPFQLTPENSRLYLEDGVVTYSAIQDNYKEGLKYLHKLYAEGLLNPESFTQDKNNQVNVNEGGSDAVIGAFLAMRPGYANDLNAEPNSNRWQQYQAIAPLKGPDGTAVATWNPYVMYQTGMTFITTSCKEPEAAFRLIDYLATQEGSYRSAFGIEGVDYRKAEPGEVGLDGKQSLVTFLPERGSVENSSWNQLVALVRYPEDCAGVTTNPDPYAEGVDPLDGRQVLMYANSKEHEKVRQPLESVLPDLYTSEDIVDELSLLKTTITDYTKESLVGFITGNMDIDSEWDAYKKQLDNLGLKRYIEILQNAYNESSFAK